MNTKFLLAALTVGAVSLNVWTATAKPVVKRIYRDARVTRGNTNVIRTQDADDASWLWLPGDGGTARVGDRDLGPHPHGGSVMDPVFLKFRRAFEGKAGDDRRLRGRALLPDGGRNVRVARPQPVDCRELAVQHL